MQLLREQSTRGWGGLSWEPSGENQRVVQERRRWGGNVGREWVESEDAQSLDRLICET